MLYNTYKLRQRKKQHKKKSLDNPVVGQEPATRINKTDLKYLLHLKKELEARDAQTTNMAIRRRLLEGQEKANFEMEMNRLKEDLHNPRMTETSIEHLKNRYDKLEKLSEKIY